MRDDRRSVEAHAYRHLYRTKQWRFLRYHQLVTHPLCCMCEEQGLVVAATVADHRRAHGGDYELFFDPTNLQSLCATHHNSAKQSEERRGYSSEVGIDGWPRDRRHPANRQGGESKT